MSVEEKYPLSEHEENLLVNELLGSGAMFIILGIVFSIAFTGLRTGDWFWSVLEFGWAYEFGQAMTLGRMPVVAAAAAVGLPAFFILVNEIVADKSNLLGSELHDGDKVVMVEDVTTSGKSIDETYPILKGAADVDVKGLIVSLNRMEVGKGGVVTAQQEVQEKYGFPVASIVSMAEVTEHLYNHEVGGRVVIDDEIKAALDKYYEQYGVK